MIYKNNYVVEFWYDTHLTHEWNGHSYDEIAAIVLACEELELKDWCSRGKGFKVIVQVAE